MAKLTTKKRERLRKSSFALPDQRKYPIFDRSHGGNALARAKQQLNAGNLTDKQYDRIVDEVCDKYPGFPTCERRNPKEDCMYKLLIGGGVLAGVAYFAGPQIKKWWATKAFGLGAAWENPRTQGWKDAGERWRGAAANNPGGPSWTSGNYNINTGLRTGLGSYDINSGLGGLMDWIDRETARKKKLDAEEKWKKKVQAWLFPRRGDRRIPGRGDPGYWSPEFVQGLLRRASSPIQAPRSTFNIQTTLR